LRDELFIRLAVMSDGPPGQLLDLVAAHRTVYLDRMAELTRAKNVIVDDSESAGATRRDDLAMESLLLDAAIYHCEADLRWLDHCELVLGRRGGGSDN
ncbi:MAG TPA: hypothetical protein VFN03_10385, partial [Trueperaceae bacterium]|nr:hypothetical protein [Trueperaceae bacterium]